MADFSNTPLQPINEANVEERVIVELTNPPQKDVMEETMFGCGILRISSVETLRRKDKKLRRDFRFWMPTLPQIDEQQNEDGEQVRTKYVPHHDVDECIEYVKTCGRQRVVLIVSGCYAQDKALIKKFKRIPQVAMIYRRISPNQFRQWSELRSFENLFSGLNKLPRNIMGTSTQDLDNASQLQMIQILFDQFIKKLPKPDEAKTDFIDFCRCIYKKSEPSLKQIQEFERTYHEDSGVYWYTRGDSFVNTIVSTTCSDFNFTNFFKIRFILHDIYIQLQKLHNEQFQMWTEFPVELYRGKLMSREKLSQLPKMGELVVTRSFLSATKDQNVAEEFACITSDDKDWIPVIISMRIDREEMRMASKPIAYVGEHSWNREEEEVILPMGIVFRTTSYEEIDDDNSRSVLRITMIRSKEEQEIEKNFSQLSLLTPTAAAVSSTIIGMVLKSIEGSEYYGEYCKLMVDATESIDPSLVEEVRSNINPDFLSELVS